MSKFLKDLASVSLGKVAIIGFNLGKAIVTARWLGPEANGLIAALTVYPTLFMSIGSLGIRQATTYFVGKDTYNLDSIKQAIIQLWVLSSIVSTIACWLLIQYFSEAADNKLLILLAILPIPSTLFNTYSSGVFLGRNEIRKFNKVEWIPPLIVFIATIVLVIILPLNTIGAMAALLVGPVYMSVVLFQNNNFLSNIRLKLNLALIKSLLSLGIVYALALLVINLNYKIDVILLDKLSTTYEVGIYSKGVALTEYLWQIPMLFSTIVFAGSANAKNGRAYSLRVAQLLRLSTISIGVASAVLILLSDWIIALLFGKSFLPSSEVQQLLLPGVLLLTIFKILNMDLAGKGKPWVSMKAMVPALILNVILNILWIPAMGAKGSALASTISYSLAAILFIFFYSKEVHIPIIDIVRIDKKDLAIIQDLYKKKIITIIRS